MHVSYELLSILVIIIGQALFIAYKIGKFEEKLITLEHKQDVHNNLIGRMYKAEQDISKAHLRIDFLENGDKKDSNA